MTRRTVPLPPNWGVIRGYVLRRDPFCRWGLLPEDGLPSGYQCTMRSVEVDHMGSPDDHRHEMLRGLCAPHHATRTGRQGAAVRNAMPSLRKRPKDKHPGFRF